MYCPIEPCGNEAAETNCSRDRVLNPQSSFLEPFTRTDGFKPVILFPQLLQLTSARSLYLDLFGGFNHHQQYMSPDIPTLTTKRTTPYKPRLVSFEASLPLSVNRDTDASTTAIAIATTHTICGGLSKRFLKSFPFGRSIVMKDVIQSAIITNSDTMRRKWMRWPRTAVRVVMSCFKMEGIETRIVAREVDTAILSVGA